MGYTANEIRNICLLGHGGDGKSALCESMLFTTKSITRLGKRADGTTVSDFDAKRRRDSIRSLLPLSPSSIISARSMFSTTPVISTSPDRSFSRCALWTRA